MADYLSSNKKKPHSQERMRERVCDCRRLIPSAVQQIVDENGDIVDGYGIIHVTVGILKADSVCIVAQQVVDQCSNVFDAHVVVHVHVTTQTCCGQGHFTNY